MTTFFSIAIALFAVPLTGAGQTNIAIAPNKMNVLYIGVDNPVSVAAAGGADERVSVSISGGEGIVSKIGTGVYNVRVAAVTDDCVLNVHVDGKLAGSSTFRVRQLPFPIGTVGGFLSGAGIAAGVFRNQAGVGAFVKDFPFDVQYEILGFTFSVDTDKGDVKAVDCVGAAFSPEVRQLLAGDIKPGRTVTIDKIRVKDAGGRILKLPSLVYSIL